MIEDLLTGEGAVKIFISDVKQAVDLVHSQLADGVDVILTYEQMPGMYALETSRQIKRLQPQSAIIGLNEHTFDTQHQRCIEAAT